MKTPPSRPTIAILAAVPLETEIIRSFWGPWKVSDLGGFHLYRRKSAGMIIELLHSGVGKANAAAAATLLALHQPQALLVVGCGGALPGSHLQLGDLVLASSEIFGDEGVLTPQGFQDLEAMHLPLLASSSPLLYNTYPVDQAWQQRALEQLTPFAAAAGIALVTGPFVTVSTCSGTTAGGEILARRSGGICENMEGAAAALVCARQNIPFCELRGISNHVEDRDLAGWDLAGAAQIAQQALITLLCNEPGQVSA
jgi:futalosine hydrolase